MQHLTLVRFRIVWDTGQVSDDSGYLRSRHPSSRSPNYKIRSNCLIQSKAPHYLLSISPWLAGVTPFTGTFTKPSRWSIMYSPIARRDDEDNSRHCKVVVDVLSLCATDFVAMGAYHIESQHLMFTFHKGLFFSSFST